MCCSSCGSSTTSCAAPEEGARAQGTGASAVLEERSTRASCRPSSSSRRRFRRWARTRPHAKRLSDYSGPSPKLLEDLPFFQDTWPRAQGVPDVDRIVEDLAPPIDRFEELAWLGIVALDEEDVVGVRQDGPIIGHRPVHATQRPIGFQAERPKLGMILGARDRPRVGGSLRASEGDPPLDGGLLAECDGSSSSSHDPRGGTRRRLVQRSAAAADNDAMRHSEATAEGDPGGHVRALVRRRGGGV
jgi:hypothetical protein